MNVFSATGNLGQDCRTGNAGGTAVVNFSIAVKSGFGDRAQTLWFGCALWGKAAESRLPEFLTKGQQVAVSGELSTEEKNGKTYLKVRCNSVDLVGGKAEGVQSTPPQTAPNQQAAPTPAAPAPGGPGPENNFDDDIPFAPLFAFMA